MIDAFVKKINLYKRRLDRPVELEGDLWLVIVEVVCGDASDRLDAHVILV